MIESTKKILIYLEITKPDGEHGVVLDCGSSILSTYDGVHRVEYSQNDAEYILKDLNLDDVIPPNKVRIIPESEYVKKYIVPVHLEKHLEGTNLYTYRHMREMEAMIMLEPGTKIYALIEQKVVEAVVFAKTRDELGTHIRVYYPCDGLENFETGVFSPLAIGRNVFFTRKEAEVALKTMKES